MTGGIYLPYGLTDFGALCAPRQMLCLVTFAATVREAKGFLKQQEYEEQSGQASVTYLATATNRGAEDSSALCRWNRNAEKMQRAFGRQAPPMVWDFCEINPFGGSVGDRLSLIDLQVNAVEGAIQFGDRSGVTHRGTATSLPRLDASFDAVLTDPPYYDNVDYSKLSDFFYAWLKRAIGHLYPEYFAAQGTPKKNEAVADPVRHGGSKERARMAYEEMMAQSFKEANRVLKPNGEIVVVYAHKTTLDWSTFVDALREAGFTVMEAWPLDTEMKSRLVAVERAALVSSIFPIARKREGSAVGSYEDQVRPELERIVRERVDSLWKMGITGADLVIAAVGAGLRPFTTRFSNVEYANWRSLIDQHLAAREDTLFA